MIVAQDDKHSHKQYWLGPGETSVYHFENKASKDNFVKVREPYEHEDRDTNVTPYDEVGLTDWSSRFSVDDFEDFQISVQSKVESAEEESKQAAIQETDEIAEADIQDRNKESKWYEPSQLNHFRRFIRVIVTTQDEATLFVMLCNPNMPEYRVNNFTNKKVTIYQKDSKDRAIVRTLNKAKTIKEKGRIIGTHTYPIPFVWDDQTLPDK